MCIDLIQLSDTELDFVVGGKPGNGQAKGKAVAPGQLKKASATGSQSTTTNTTVDVTGATIIIYADTTSTVTIA